MEASEERSALEGAIQHARAALVAEDTSEADYHIKEAMQLLDVDACSHADR